jgi:galactokinase
MVVDMYSGNEIHSKVVHAKALFENLFGKSSRLVANISPASLILMGDHTHYNEGVLISTCIDRYWIFIINKRKDFQVNLISTELNDIVNFTISTSNNEKNDSYRLLRGLIKILFDEGHLKYGFDCVLSSNIPECFGLGSLASYQVGFVNTLMKVFRFEFDQITALEYVRKNELNLIGKISNIAHHYTIMFGKEKKIFFFDLKTLEYKILPWPDNNYSLVICDTIERNENRFQICNERIDECAIGVKGLRLYIWGIKNLRDVELDFLLKHYHMLPKLIFNRVLFNVNERLRAFKAFNFLKNKSIKEFGELIIKSHLDLIHNYDIGFENCNFIVEESIKIKSVACSKMISCTPINSSFHIVENSEVEHFANTMKNLFQAKYHKQLVTHIVKLSGGINKISSKELSSVIQ